MKINGAAGGDKGRQRQGCLRCRKKETRDKERSQPEIKSANRDTTVGDAATPSSLHTRYYCFSIHAHICR